MLDVTHAEMPVAVLDASAAAPAMCLKPYPAEIFLREGKTARAGAVNEQAWSCRLAGKSCLAGDVIGEYSFAAPLHVGQRLVFGDMAIYSMVKTTTFNGLRLPSIGVCEPASEGKNRFSLLRAFGYQDFMNRLS